MEKIVHNEVQLKNIAQLSGMEFIIPDYQRGYRWTEFQVEQLLNDIYEFAKKKNTAAEEEKYYCLQPVVVCKRGENQYEVIDGQQRLTTIFIILKYLENVRKVLFRKFKLYSLQYETRPNSTAFLEQINTENKSIDSKDNIDFYFMQQVYDTVKKWFDPEENEQIENKKSEEIDPNEFILALLSQDEIRPNVRIIWYEVTDDVKEHKATPVKLFSRLNIGKIPLTNSELIKALLLNYKNFPRAEVILQQIRIATEWNNIEQKLQNDSFWNFIFPSNNKIQYDNRIEYLFDLMKKRTKDSETYHTFNMVKDNFDNKKDAENIWKDVKDYFLTLEEWYEDRKLYHLIGFLIEYGADINDLCNESTKRDKDDFLSYIYRRIKEKSKKYFPLEELDYSQPQIVREVLLLFNLCTILAVQEAEMRFPFNKFKTEKWDIEHICSQTDKYPTSYKEWVKWAEDLLTFWENTKKQQEMPGKIEEIIKSLKTLQKELEETKKIPDSNNPLFTLITDYIKKSYDDESLENRDNIANLTLLSSQINRGYGNAIFPIKRSTIIEKDKAGEFIPIATKNVFLKYYSENTGNLMQWTQTDANAYLEEIQKKLEPYAPDGTIN